DGFSLYPYRDSGGMLWVPQQLWTFRRMPFGVWTVCAHANSWTLADVDRLRSDLNEFAASMTDWNSVICLYRHRGRSVVDRLFSGIYPGALKVRLAVRTRERPRDAHSGLGTS